MGLRPAPYFGKLVLGISVESFKFSEANELQPRSLQPPCRLCLRDDRLGRVSYGRKLDLWQPKSIGLALMIYPYFFTNNWLLWGIGVGLLVLLWFYHHE